MPASERKEELRSGTGSGTGSDTGSGTERRAESVAGALAIAGILTWMWGMATVVGALMLMAGGVAEAGRQISPTRAVFQAVSCSTLTGFTASVGMADLTRYGQTVCLALTVVGTLCALIIGGMAIRRVAGIRSGDGSVVTAAFALLAVASVVAMLTRDSVGALSAIGNSGLRLSPPREATSPLWFGVFLPLAMAGGLGVAVLLDVRDRLFGRVAALSQWTWDALTGAAVVFVGLSGLIWVTQGAGFHLASLASAVGRAGTWMGYGVSLAPAGAGVGEVTRATEMMLIWVPVVGVALGGTAGGVGAGSLLHALRRGLGVLRGKPGSAVAVIVVAMAAAVGILAGMTWVVLLTTEPQLGADRLLLLAVSSATNTGLSGGATGSEPVSVVGPGLWAMSAAMVLGRVIAIGGAWMMVVFGRAMSVPRD